MATPQEKLAESMEVLRTLQDQGTVAIRSRDLADLQALVQHLAERTSSIRSAI